MPAPSSGSIDDDLALGREPDLVAAVEIEVRRSEAREPAGGRVRGVLRRDQVVVARRRRWAR